MKSAASRARLSEYPVRYKIRTKGLDRTCEKKKCEMGGADFFKMLTFQACKRKASVPFLMLVRSQGTGSVFPDRPGGRHVRKH